MFFYREQGPLKNETEIEDNAVHTFVVFQCVTGQSSDMGKFDT